MSPEDRLRPWMAAASPQGRVHGVSCGDISLSSQSVMICAETVIKLKETIALAGQFRKYPIMKTLHLLRHAKSAWDKPNLSDRDRGLNKRGKRDAPRMGEALSQRMAPMEMYVSPARRAQLTLKGLCSGWPGLNSIDHTTVEDLYTFSSKDLCHWITQQDNNEGALFIISHNPALTDLVNTLIGHPGLDNLPTAGYVELAIPVDHWQDLPQFDAVLEYSLFPRELN